MKEVSKAPPRHLAGSKRAAQNQCADKNLGTKFRERGNSLYLAVLIGRTKSTLNYAIFDFSLMRKFLSPGTDSGQSLHVNAHAACIHQAGSMRSFAFSTLAVACSSSGSSTGLSKQSGALITRDGSRQEIADIPRFAAPPGDAHRTRGSLTLAPSQHAGCNTNARPS